MHSAQEQGEGLKMARIDRIMHEHCMVNGWKQIERYRARDCEISVGEPMRNIPHRRIKTGSGRTGGALQVRRLSHSLCLGAARVLL